MKLIPLLRVNDLRSAIAFYTTILGFRLKYPDAPANDWGVELVIDESELQLTVGEGDQKSGIAVYVEVNDIDSLFAALLERGLDRSGKPNSPVHQAPLNQSWGTRELYVDDPGGNTLRFVQA